MSATKIMGGLVAWIGLTLVQLVIAGVMFLVAFGLADASVRMLGHDPDVDPWKVVAVILLVVIAGIELLVFEYLIKRTPLKWLSLAANPIWHLG